MTRGYLLHRGTLVPCSLVRKQNTALSGMRKSSKSVTPQFCCYLLFRRKVGLELPSSCLVAKVNKIFLQCISNQKKKTGSNTTSGQEYALHRIQRMGNTQWSVICVFAAHNLIKLTHFRANLLTPH